MYEKHECDSAVSLTAGLTDLLRECARLEALRPMVSREDMVTLDCTVSELWAEVALRIGATGLHRLARLAPGLPVHA